MLELPRDSVPHFMAKGPTQNDEKTSRRIDAWLALRGLARYIIWYNGTLDELREAAQGQPYILSGNARDGIGHCVVGHGNRIAHNPTPEVEIVEPFDEGHWLVEIVLGTPVVLSKFS